MMQPVLSGVHVAQVYFSVHCFVNHWLSSNICVTIMLAVQRFVGIWLSLWYLQAFSILNKHYRYLP